MFKARGCRGTPGWLCLGIVAALLAGTSVVVSAAVTTISSCPDDSICPELFAPTCGTDAKTYGNDCFAKCNKVDVKHAGACTADDVAPGASPSPHAVGISPEMAGPSPSPSDSKFPCPACTMELRPVCGEDGKTYPNECTAYCDGQRNYTQGECKKFACPACTMEYNPFCGEDGKTYSNECTAYCAGQRNYTEGECQGTKDVSPSPSPAPDSKFPCPVCTLEYNPYCGEDGKTYSNECDAYCAGQRNYTQGECKKYPCPACPANYMPVCGADGKTYPNECTAYCADVKYVPGECPQALSSPAPPKFPCPACTLEYNPYCGEDGKTYGNECTAYCAGQRNYTQGECKKYPCPACPANWMPVCGDDGKTYGNECMAYCAGIKYTDGECQGSQSSPSPPKFACPVCTMDYNPVCGEDGKTYGNECTAYCAGLRKYTPGECQDTKSSPAPPKFPCPVCTLEYNPYCGEDGNTYGNECAAYCAGQRNYTQGECKKFACPVCTMDYKPVCGEDGKTYPNECTAYCDGQRNYSEGECQTQATVSPPPPGGQTPCPCPYNIAPVCGADGWTYSNECVAKCAGTTVASKGNCPPCPPDTICTMEYAPWCGADGKTYANKCMARCSGVLMAHEGECELQPEASSPPVSPSPSPSDSKFPCPACTKEYDPVCGEDGQTYNNPCNAYCYGHVEHWVPGRCEDITGATCDGWCNKDGISDVPSCASSCVGQAFTPVCGADGKTYSNACNAKCAGVKLVSLGVCGACYCDPRKKEPVCGANGITYLSQCTASCLGVLVAHDGPCMPDNTIMVPDNMTCSDCKDASYDPVCVITLAGAREFPNGCAAKCSLGAGVNSLPYYKGSCVPKCDYTCGADRLGSWQRFDDPVCCGMGGPEDYRKYSAEYPNKCYYSCLTGDNKAVADMKCKPGLCTGQDAIGLLRTDCKPGAVTTMCIKDSCNPPNCPGVKDAICYANTCTRYFRLEWLGGNSICRDFYVAPDGSDLLTPQSMECKKRA